MSDPFKLGLTGSIGMGKSTTAALFADHGCAVWDADEAVHRLYGRNGAAVDAIARLHPDAVEGGAVSRPALKAWIAKDPKALGKIEAIVHPLVSADRAAFLADTQSDIAVLDIPLLFEGGTKDAFDAVAVVSAPADIQRARVLARPGTTDAHFERILANQMPDAEKRKHADFIIETCDHSSAQVAVSQIVKDIRARNA
ncbi:dephospho-CoA kinase [Meridianimarinicoccus aquatilis]|nr:dephospho-CoA kinase [Fluviibacterium aquatile]